MPDPVRCCILGICCQPGSKEQVEALAEFMGRTPAAASVGKDALLEIAAGILADFKLVSH